MSCNILCSDGVTLTFVNRDMDLNKTLSNCALFSNNDDEPIPVPFTSDLLRRVQMFTTLRSMHGFKNKWDPLTAIEIRLLGPSLQDRVELCNVANFLDNTDLLHLAAKGIAQLIQ